MHCIRASSSHGTNRCQIRLAFLSRQKLLTQPLKGYFTSYVILCTLTSKAGAEMSKDFARLDWHMDTEDPKEGDISSMSKSFVTSSRYLFGDMTLNSEFDRLAALYRVLQGLDWSPENCMWGGHT